MKNKSHNNVAFKWSSVDKGLLPALSGVVKNTFLTLPLGFAASLVEER